MPASDAPAPLTQVELAVIRELHADCCDPDCDVPNLFAAIDALAAERDALRIALVTAAVPLEVLYASTNVKPYLSEEIERAIFEAVVAIRGAIRYHERALGGAAGARGGDE
jgi:hypothetical protein